MFGWIKNVVRGAAQAATSGHTPDSAHAAIDAVIKRRSKAAAAEQKVREEIADAQSARSAVIALVADEIRQFERAKARL